MTDEDRIHEFLSVFRRIGTHCHYWQTVQQDSGLAYIVDREMRRSLPNGTVLDPPVPVPKLLLVDLDDWDRQHDGVREQLMKALETRVPNKWELVNRMEVARRVFNTYAVTGKVEVPE